MEWGLGRDLALPLKLKSDISRSGDLNFKFPTQKFPNCMNLNLVAEPPITGSNYALAQIKLNQHV